MSARSPLHIIPVILSGGSGTRLWPVSREAMPKPFMKLAGGKSLLQLTWERAWRLPTVSHAAVVTNMAYSYKSAEELMTETGATQISMLLEPVGRNTAPAIALAALWAKERFGGDVVILILAADHLIDKQAEFEAAVLDAAELAHREDRLVLFGIEPTGPVVRPGPDGFEGRADHQTRFASRGSRDRGRDVHRMPK